MFLIFKRDKNCKEENIWSTFVTILLIFIAHFYRIILFDIFLFSSFLLKIYAFFIFFGLFIVQFFRSFDKLWMIALFDNISLRWVIVI